MKQKNYEKGITLIALVITIIVLLILAGVTINIVINQGIMDKSQTAVDEYKVSEYKENIEVIKIGEHFRKINEKLSESLKDLVVTKLEKETWVKVVETSEEDPVGLEENQIKVITKDNYIIVAEIEEDGKITYITIEIDNGELYPTLKIEQLPLEGTENEKIKIRVKAEVEKIKKTKKIATIELIKDGVTIETRNYDKLKVEDIFEVEENGTYRIKAITDQGKSTSKKINIIINTLTIKYYLENENDTNYTLSNITKSIVEYGTIINLADYKTEIENGTYSYGSLTDSTSGGTAITSTSMGENTTIALYYSRNTYTLTLLAGTYIDSVTGGGTYKVGQSVIIDATLSKNETGYTVSWSEWISNNTSLLSNNSNQNATITMPEGNVTLTANATGIAKTYTITYNTNGGIGAPASQTKTYGVDLTLSSTVPYYTNATFLGWAENNDATTATYQPGDNYTANEDVILYAIWGITFTNGYHVWVDSGTTDLSKTSSAYLPSGCIATISYSQGGHVSCSTSASIGGTELFSITTVNTSGTFTSDRLSGNMLTLKATVGELNSSHLGSSASITVVSIVNSSGYNFVLQ